MTTANLDLGVIGNGSFGALVDAQARVVWSCLPAFDGDPAFCARPGLRITPIASFVSAPAMTGSPRCSLWKWPLPPMRPTRVCAS